MKNKKHHIQWSIFNKILNIANHEMPRVIIAWFLKLSWQISYIIIWTLLMAFSVKYYGINSLLYLFLVNAGMMILGTLVFAVFFNESCKEKILIILSILIAVFLGVITGIYSFNTMLFFLLIIFTNAVLMVQLNISISLFIEELFTPTESERIFPVLESAETVGGIIAGAILFIFVNIISDIQYLFLFALFSILAINLIIFIFEKEEHQIPDIVLLEDEINTSNFSDRIANFKKGFNHIKKIPFLKSLVLVIALYWIIFSILDVEFTNAVNMSVGHGDSHHGTHQEEVNLHNNYYENEVNHKSATAHDQEKHSAHSNADHHSSNDHIHVLTHGLSGFHMLFSSIGLLMQLFLAGRIISNLGIVSSMIVYSGIHLFTILGMIFGINTKYHLLTFAIAKGDTEFSGILFKNAYHSSYYALSEEDRGYAKEFMEGIVKPLGIIFGISMILLVEYLFMKMHIEIDVHFLHVVFLSLFSILITIIIFSLRDKLTNVSKYHLNIEGDHHDKLDAIEILSEKGHKNNHIILGNILHSKQESPLIKCSILKALGRIRNIENLSEILDHLHDSDAEIRREAMFALKMYGKMHSHLQEKGFSRKRLIEGLKKYFQETTDIEMQTHIIKIFANMHDPEIIDFLLDLLQKSENEDLIAHIIYVIGLFKDPNSEAFIAPFLNSKNVLIRGNVAISLYQFRKYKKEAQKIIDELLYSKDEQAVEIGAFAAGEVKWAHEKERLEELLEGDNDKIRHIAALSLAKLDDEKSIPDLVHIMLSDDHNFAHKVLHTVHHLHEPFRGHVLKSLMHYTAEELNKILKKYKNIHINKYEKQDLLRLLHLYELVGRKSDILKILHALESV